MIYSLHFFSDDAISIISIIMASSIFACVNCSAKQEAGRNYILISGIIDREFKDYVISYEKGKMRSTALRLRDDYLCRKCSEILRKKFKVEQKGSYYSPRKKTAKIHKSNHDMHEKEIGVIFVAAFYVRKMDPEEELQHQKGPFMSQLQ